ncbi:MAG: hypothetical protein QM805_11665 [Pseudomonas sp.]
MAELTLQYEHMRLNLISALKFVAKTDEEIVHARHNGAGELVSFIDLNVAVGIIFDMVPYIVDEPEKAIGELLVDQHEADVVKLAVDTLDAALPDTAFLQLRLRACGDARLAGGYRHGRRGLPPVGGQLCILFAWLFTGPVSHTLVRSG